MVLSVYCSSSQSLHYRLFEPRNTRKEKSSEITESCFRISQRTVSGRCKSTLAKNDMRFFRVFRNFRGPIPEA